MSNYTIAEAREVMRQTQEILDAPGYGADPRTARAAATTRPPQQEFTDIIVRLQTENPDLSLREAVRSAAIKEPELHKKWVAKENEKLAASEQEKKDSAARVRNRNR